ncbi:hypothetical protein [Streptomyces sp. NPDC054854]
MNHQLSIRLRGTFGKGELAAFRDQVGLTPRGRIDDDWDEEFGRRDLRPEGAGKAELSLWRYADDDWKLSLRYEGAPLPAAEVEELRRTVLDAAGRAGLTATVQNLS